MASCELEAKPCVLTQRCPGFFAEPRLGQREIRVVGWRSDGAWLPGVDAEVVEDGLGGVAFWDDGKDFHGAGALVTNKNVGGENALE